MSTNGDRGIRSTGRFAARARGGFRLGLGISAAFALTMATRGASAQITGGPTPAADAGFAVDRFEPAPAGDLGFGVQQPTVRGKLLVNGALILDYAHAPLVLRFNGVNNDATVGKIVSRQMSLHLAASIAIAERVLLSVDAPTIVQNEGDSPSTAAGTRFESPGSSVAGDIRLGARVRLFGEIDAPFQLALAGYLWAPTGSRQNFTSDGKVRGNPSLIVGGLISDVILWSATGGITLRPSTRVLSTSVDHELTYGAQVGALVLQKMLLIGPELYGSTSFGNGVSPFGKHTTNAELLFGVKFRPDPVQIGVAAGPGLSTGLGTPDWRLVAVVAYAPWGNAQEAAAPPPKPGDRDDDGIIDIEDACPDVKGVKNADPKKNGCPPDKDGDGIADEVDACIDVPGVKSDDPKKNGCPPDRDGDSIVDAEDACPDEPGPKSEDPKKNGCPLVTLTAKSIEIHEQVHFEFNKATILPDSDTLLAAVAKVFVEHPELKKVQIEGHTDNKGAAAYNQQLSQKRAEAVMKWMIAHGVDKSRLVAKGFGMSKPIADNKTEDGRAANRRVEFNIVDPAPPKNP